MGWWKVTLKARKFWFYVYFFWFHGIPVFSHSWNCFASVSYGYREVIYCIMLFLCMYSILYRLMCPCWGVLAKLSGWESLFLRVGVPFDIYKISEVDLTILYRYEKLLYRTLVKYYNSYLSDLSLKTVSAVIELLLWANLPTMYRYIINYQFICLCTSTVYTHTVEIQICVTDSDWKHWTSEPSVHNVLYTVLPHTGKIEKIDIFLVKLGYVSWPNLTCIVFL